MPPEHDKPDTDSRRVSLRVTLAICAALVIAGAVALAVIFNTEPEVQRESAVRESAMLVEVTTAEAGDFRPLIHAVGTVVPAKEITLRPRVAGEIVEISAAFVPGGFVRAGEVLQAVEEAAALLGVVQGLVQADAAQVTDLAEQGVVLVQAHVQGRGHLGLLGRAAQLALQPEHGLGELVNFGLGVFSPTVHALRLHFVEFFGNFYSPGGLAYRPFRHWRATDVSTPQSATP